MSVGLVTNWDEKCAVAEYARNLTEYCLKADKEVSFKIITRPLVYEAVWEQIKDVDVVHFNYCAHAFSQMSSDAWHNFKTIKPVVMTVHESSDWMVRRLVKTNLADKLVMHDRFRDGLPTPEEVVTIPYGIPEVDTSDIKVERGKVGTFGCAFPWKGLVALAYACSKANLSLSMFLSEPDSEMGKIDWSRMKAEILEYCPSAEISTEWLPQSEVIQKLASCAVIALPFEPCSPITGISASVRLALAARRPLVLTRFFHFADLYEDIYVNWINTLDELNGKLRKVMNWVDRSNLLYGMPSYNKMKWSVAAKMYTDLYRKVCSGQSITVGQS